MTSSFGNIIGTQRDQIPKPVIPNYAQTEPNLEEKVNEQIERNQQDLRQFGEELAQIEELKAKNFFDNLSGLESLVSKVGDFATTREANREARETRQRFREISKDTRKRVLEYNERLQDVNKAQQEAILRELANEDKVAFELLKAQYFPDIQDIDFQETKDRFTSLGSSSFNTYIEDKAYYNQNLESDAELILEDGIELILTNFYVELARKNVDINSSQVQRYVNRTLLPRLIKEREAALRTWNTGSVNRLNTRVNLDLTERIVDAFNSYEEVTTTDASGFSATDIVYNGVFDAAEGEGGLIELIMLKKGYKTPAEAMAYLMSVLPNIKDRLDPGGIEYFKNTAKFYDKTSGKIVEGYANSSFGSPGVLQSNLSYLDKIQTAIIQSEDEAYSSIVKKYSNLIMDFKAANNNKITPFQLADFENKFVNELIDSGLRTDLIRPTFFTGDETSSQGSESYSSKVGVANALSGKINYTAAWESRLKTDANPFYKLDDLQKLAVVKAEAELQRLVEEEKRQNVDISVDEAIARHYDKVLNKLVAGDFDISYDSLRPTTKADVENDINAFKTNKSEWIGNATTNSVFEKRALLKYVEHVDSGFKTEFPAYLEIIANANGMRGREYAIQRLRALGLLSANNKLAENPEDTLELSKEDKDFLFYNFNSTKTLSLLNTADDNRSNERAMLTALKTGNGVNYYEGKGLGQKLKEIVFTEPESVLSVEQVYNLAKKGATNFGLYGFSSEELIAAVDSGAISLDADFNEDTQSLMAVELVRVQANKSNSIMGAVTEADSDWRRLSNLKEVEKAAILRFFPTLRGMPNNQFHNLQQDIALVFLNELEQTNQKLGLDQFILNNPEFDFLNDEGRKSIRRGNYAPLTDFIGGTTDLDTSKQLKLRQFFQKRINEGEFVPKVIRRSLKNSRANFDNEKFDYFKKFEEANKETKKE